VTPGGVVESGEAITDATVREVFEETGVRITLGNLSGVYQNLSTDVVTFVFRAEPDAVRQGRSNDRNDAETENVRWLTVAEAEQIMRQPFVTRIHDALTRRSDPYLRTIHEPHLMAPR
jgi:ADP-ribose pyrophosphatase YjhB (NUDIX family)